MQSKRFLTSVILLMLLAAAAATLQSQNKSALPTDPEYARHSSGVNLMRAINTSEYSYQNKHGSFAAKETLLASDEFKGMGQRWAAKYDPEVGKMQPSDGEEVFPGWALRLNLTEDGKGYEVFLQDLKDKSCGYAVYSDERGVIWQSKTIGCPM